ncbi:MAG: phosphotransferase [Bdellovibrio sp.]|nr:phosphotransferase [Bdellovibrio sp.]
MDVLGHTTQFFFELTPDRLLGEIERVGLRPTGRCMPLNSLENRVIEVELSDPLSTGEKSIVVKFYRPGRWRPEAILEDHAFSLLLSQSGLDVITPVSINKSTLFSMQDQLIYWAIYPKVRGQLIDEPTHEQLQILGLKIAQLHEIGATFQSHFRPRLTVDNYGLCDLLESITRLSNYSW